MFEVFTHLFDSTGFSSQQNNGEGWTPALIWLHITSDLLIWLAYISIPLMLLYFTRRRDLPYPRLFILFAIFILACGTTHLIEAIIFDYPLYRLAGVMKLITAVVSWVTVIALIPVVPRAMSVVTEATKPSADTKLHRTMPSNLKAGRVREYIIAILAGLLAILIRAAIDPIITGDHIFVISLLAVVYVSWQYGFGPGMVCLVVGVVGYAFFFIPPKNSWFVSNVGTQLALSLFFFCGVACAALGESQHTAQRRAKVALASAVSRQEELESEVIRRRVVEAALRQRETELLAAQRETSEALASLKAFFDNAPVGIAFFDTELRYLRINPYLAAANGKPVSEHIGRKLSEVLPDFPHAMLDAYKHTTTAEGKPFTAQVCQPDIRQPRALRVWQVTAFPVREASDRTLGAGVFAQDVTDRLKAEDALRESEARFRSMADSVPALIWLSELDGRRTYFNKTWLLFTGREPAQDYDFGWIDNIHPDDRDLYLIAYNHAFATRQPFEQEYRLRRHDGEYRWVLARGTPRFTSAGDLAGFVGLCLDVTESRAAAETVRQSEERYRVLTEAVPHIVWNADASGEITYFNRRWLEYTSVPVEEAHGEGWMTAVHPDDRDRVYNAWRETVSKVSPGGDRFNHEFRLRDANTSNYRWFLSVAVPLMDSSGRVDRWIGSMADIHDQKTAAETIRESETFRRSVFENSPDCLMIFDTDGRLLEMNQAGGRLMELDDFDSVKGSHWAELWPAANRETIHEVIGTARIGQIGRFQGFCPTAKGTAKYWDASIAAIPGGDGRPYRLIGISRDITEHRRAEERIRESEEMFRQLAESIPQLAWMTDPDGYIFWYNQRWYDYTGTTLDDMKERGWEHVLEPNELPRVTKKFREHIASGEMWEDTFTLRGRDGKFRWHLSRARPMRDASGAIIRWFGTNTDISAQQEMEQSLRASEERFRTLTEAVPQMVWTANPKGEITFTNRRWDEYTGVHVTPETPHVWSGDLIHHDEVDEFQKAWKQTMAEKAEVFGHEFRLRRAEDGIYRWMLAVAVPLTNTTGATVEWVGTLTDIDDQKRHTQILESLVRERTAELQRSNEDLEKFAYIASHDLQEPLRKIQAFGDRLRNKCRDSLPDSGKEYVDRMNSAAGRMRRLIDDLLTFSRVTTQQRPYGRVDLRKLVIDVLSDLEVRLNQTNGIVRVGQLPVIDADVTQMRQLFQNLLVNAVKFHRPGVPPVVEVDGEYLNHFADVSDSIDPVPMCRLTVRDNGIGFDEKYRDRIFDVFQRLHGRNEYEGTGVGLAICRKIVERHGGTIRAISREGEGATFVVDLPTRQPPTTEARSDDVQQEQTDHNPAGRR